MSASIEAELPFAHRSWYPAASEYVSRLIAVKTEPSEEVLLRQWQLGCYNNLTRSCVCSPTPAPVPESQPVYTVPAPLGTWTISSPPSAPSPPVACRRGTGGCRRPGLRIMRQGPRPVSVAGGTYIRRGTLPHTEGGDRAGERWESCPGRRQ